jgi:hypothetical protein
MSVRFVITLALMSMAFALGVGYESYTSAPPPPGAPMQRFTPPGCPDARILALSPNGLERLDFVVEDRPTFAMPGQGSDVGGHIVLVDRDTDLVLAASGYVPLLSGFDARQVKWSSDCVRLTIDENDGPVSVKWPLRAGTSCTPDR